MPRSRSPIGSKVADQPLEVIDWEPALGIAENILGSCHELLVGGHLVGSEEDIYGPLTIVTEIHGLSGDDRVGWASVRQ